MKIKIYVLVLMFLGFGINVVFGDTTFVHVVDFKNGRFSSDIELAIEYKDGKLNLFTRSKTVGEIFKEIEKKAKIEINVDEETAQKKVSIFVSDKTLKEGIEAVLNTIGQRDLAISYREVSELASERVSQLGTDTSQTRKPANPQTSQPTYEISKVEIRKRTKAEMKKIEEAEQKEADEWARQRDKEYHELFARMEKEKNKVAKALSDFSNPKASQKQKTQVMTYLRQATIEPKDKPLLREAYRDLKFADLKGAIAMGLIHAIADNPEESDKEFLLELFKTKEMGGMLMYSMKFIWDDRFIPELIKVVKDTTEYSGERSTAAEILGVRKVKEAVPALEEAFLEMEDVTSIHSALFNITGLYYRVKNGKLEKSTTDSSKPAPDIEMRHKEYLEKLEKKKMDKK